MTCAACVLHRLYRSTTLGGCLSPCLSRYAGTRVIVFLASATASMVGGSSSLTSRKVIWWGPDSLNHLRRG